MSYPPTSAAAFEAKYRDDPDPWNFRSSPYERGRYRTLLTSLSRAHYQHAFEPGCSIGELTVQLAERCDRVTATDLSSTALNIARRRCSSLPNVRFVRADLGLEIPAERFDLIVLSEVAYYFQAATLRGIAEQLQRMLTPGGELIVSHWLGDSIDHVLHGDEVHRIVASAVKLHHRRAVRYQQFRLDSWVNE